MGEWWSMVAVSFTAIFVVVEPLGVVPVFGSLMQGRSRDEVARTALRASLVGASILLVFGVAGEWLLGALAIRLDAFRAAGGGLLLLTALDMLRAKQSECRCSSREVAGAATRADVAVVPVAIPLLAGPGAMATVMVLMAGGGPARISAVVVSILATFAASYAVLRSSRAIERVLGDSALAAMQRVFGLVLAAMSTQLILTGVRELLLGA